MTLETTTVKKSYAGDGGTVAFPTTFIFWDVADIEVILLDALGVETTWVEGTEYDLTGGSGSTGTVTVKTVPTDYTPAIGETLLIRSNRDDKQDDAFPLGGAFPSTVVEQALDQLTRLIQQRTEELGRVLSVKKTSELEGIEVPDPVTGQILVGNAAGDGYDNAEPLEGSAILNDNNLGTSQTQATSQNSILEFFKNGVVTMINKVLKGCHLQADDGAEILDPGTDGTDAVFTGSVVGFVVFRGCFVYLKATQTIANTTATKIDFSTAQSTELYDTTAFHDPDTNSTRITIPAGVSKVRVNAGIPWIADATGWRSLNILKNGVVNYPGTGSKVLAASIETEQQVTSGVIPVTPGDYFEIEVAQNSGGPLDVRGSSTSGAAGWFAVEVAE